MTIYLTGYRGSGKSTVGKLLAKRLGQEFRDTDEWIAAMAGKSIKEIFAAHGEGHFRELESQALKELSDRDRHVIALGGGALMRPENRAFVRPPGGHLIYLRCEPEELLRRIQSDPATSDNRPSLTSLGGSLEEIKRLLDQREPIYRQLMTAEIDVTDLSPQAAVEQILRIVCPWCNPNPAFMDHAINITFAFLFGACIGSFLNVVVYRLPLEISLIKPASHCPKCKALLPWYDNIPVLGWIKLGGKCRFCKAAISPRYPIIEAITGLLFVFYYVMIFMAHAGPSSHQAHLPPDWNFFAGDLNFSTGWPIYAIYMVLISGLLAASLIDAELFIIPASIPWCVGAIAIVVHAIVDRPNLPGALLATPREMALCAGAAIGLIISIVLLELGVIPLSFPEGDLLEVEREKLDAEVAKAMEKGEEAPEVPPQFTRKQVQAEMRKEMLFLMPPMILAGISALLAQRVPAIGHFWVQAYRINWVNAFLGSLLGAIVAGFVVWIIRIGGSLVFGKEAMGLGDIHLMFGVGAVIGGGAATVAFFIAPFFGIIVAIYMLLTGTRRQLPYGPYLSLATAFIILFYSPFAAYMRPGLEGLIDMLHQSLL